MYPLSARVILFLSSLKSVLQIVQVSSESWKGIRTFIDLTIVSLVKKTLFFFFNLTYKRAYVQDITRNKHSLSAFHSFYFPQTE